MRKLTEVEYEVMRHFDITATKIQMADGDEWMPSLADVAAFCMHQGYSYEVYDKITAGILLTKLANKITNPDEDAFSLEDLATWLFTHYYTKQELKELPCEDAVSFLKDWKYFFGFRKLDAATVANYIDNALAVFDGEYELCKNSDEIMYLRKER